MKRYIGLILMLASLPFSAMAEDEVVTYLDEVKALGVVAGQGMACKASKYSTFEMLARAIIVTKASSDNEQEQGMLMYNNQKATMYVSKKMDGLESCDTIKYLFDAQPIFQMRLYADGTIKMPDGKIFTPRQPYDARLIYKKDENELARAEAAYNSAGKNMKNIKIKVLEEQ